MAEKVKPNGYTIYTLTIEYNKNTAEIVGIKEEFRETEKTFSYGELYMEDCWDEDTITLMDQMYDIGVS